MKTKTRPTIVSAAEWRQLAKQGKTSGVAIFAKLVKKEDGTVSFIASDSSPDRHGDTVQAAGWKLDNFKKNPVLLWAHSHYDPPVGKVGSIAVVSDKLIADKCAFTSEEENPFGASVGRMVKGGFLNTVSVGFMPLKWELRYDGEGEFLGYNFIEQELLELSVVPVPAHPNALVTSKAFAEQLRAWSETEAHEPMTRSFQAELQTLFKTVDDVEEAQQDAEDQSAFERMEKLLERIAKGVEGPRFTVRLGEIEVSGPDLASVKALLDVLKADISKLPPIPAKAAPLVPEGDLGESSVDLGRALSLPPT